MPGRSILAVMLTVARDVSLALRDLRRRPGVPLVIVLSLGAAMGLTTSLFSIVNAMWFRPWRVPDAHELRVVSPGIAQEARCNPCSPKA